MASQGDSDRPYSEHIVASRKQLLDASATLVCELDEHGVFVRANAPLAGVLGTAIEHVTHLRFVDCLHHEDREAGAATLPELVARPGEARSLHGRFLGAGGAMLWLSWHAMFDARLGLVYALAHDVTARIQAEQAAAREHAAAPTAAC